MDTKSTSLVLMAGVPLVLLLLGGVAGSDSNAALGAEASEARSGSAAPELDDTLRQEQDAALKAEVGNLTEVASQLRDGRDSVETASTRTRELEEQTRNLTEQTDFQRLEAAKA